MIAPPSAARPRLVRSALRVEYFTLGWNVLETVAGLAAGVAAGSIALIGFGLDSIVEASSATILVWRLRTERGVRSAQEAEKTAVKMLSIAFFTLAAYVAVRSVFDLSSGTRPEDSVPGIVLAAVSLIVMPLLARRKTILARKLESRALAADSTQTSLCTYLSGLLLVGLVANSVLGWWWADPLAGLGIAGLAAKEGRELWNGDDS